MSFAQHGCFMRVSVSTWKTYIILEFSCYGGGSQLFSMSISHDVLVFVSSSGHVFHSRNQKKF